MNRGLLLLAALLGTAASWAQPAAPPVRSLEVTELACSRDGWCSEHPWPLDITVADGDGQRLVAGGAGGMLVLHEGTWRAGLDTGLDQVVRVELKPDRVLACDTGRCVEVSLREGGFGPVLPIAFSRPPKSLALEGVFGEAGRYALKNGRLQVFVQDQRVLSQRATDALGAAGTPLWILQRSDVSRYSSDAMDARQRVEVSCRPWCWGGHGRLFGDAHAPWLQLPLYLFQGLFRFDGERFSPVFSRGFDVQEHPEVLVGAGCAPCLFGGQTLAIRHPDRWDFMALPEHTSPRRPGTADPSSVGSPSRHLRAVGLGDEGWPTLVFDFPYERPPLPPQAWSFDGTRWSLGARTRTERVARSRPDPFGRPPVWARVDAAGDGCSVRAPWGEQWTLREATLTIRGPGGRREERLPAGSSHCAFEVFTGEHGVFILFFGTQLVSKRWERLSWGTDTGPTGTWRVVGVERDDVLQVRRGPDPLAGIVTALAPGACVEAMGTPRVGNGGAWRKVRGPEGAVGWANTRYLRAEPCSP